MDEKLIEAAARGFAQGLVGGTHPLVEAAAPRPLARRRSAPPPAAQMPLPLPDATGGPLHPDAAGGAPVPEWSNGEPVGPVLTQAEMERMERVLRGEQPVETYVPENVEEQPWKGS